MAVSETDVARVAELSNLDLTSDEKSRMMHDLNSILEYVAQLNEVNTATVSPMAQVGEQLREWKYSDQPRRNLRADELAPTLCRDEVLAAAPDTDGLYFRVPKVIER